MKNPKFESEFLTAQNATNCVVEARRIGREITVVVSPTDRRIGLYVARLGEGGQTLSRPTAHPFVDAARSLIAAGFDPGITLLMRHAGSETVCLRATIGAAAALTVAGTKFAPEFRRWKALSTPAVPRRIA